MCGIFAFLSYGPEVGKKFVLQTLVNGLRRLEYRGYDSAGVCVDEKDDAVVSGVELSRIVNAIV